MYIYIYINYNSGPITDFRGTACLISSNIEFAS